jgi:hypothetical protein
MVTAFADKLQPSEVLLLWDRIIGFDTLMLLPVLAASVFAFRRKALFEATTVGGVPTCIFPFSKPLRWVVFRLVSFPL